MTRHDRRRHNASQDRRRELGDWGQKEGLRDDVRRAIAHGAARLIAEGLTDYLAAKQKAARQLGITDKKSLPDNHEIELALREHLALFAHDTQTLALNTLRDTALRAMQWLDRFSPWISGAVLNGTANEFSEIELELIGTDVKSFELFLLNETIEFDVRETIDREHDRHIVTYEFEFEDVPVSIALYDSHAQRVSLYPRSSIRHERAQLKEAIARFEVREKP